MKKEGGGFGCDLASLGEVSTRMDITKDEVIKHCPVLFITSYAFAGTSRETSNPA